MKRVLTALVLVPLVLLAVFRAPDWLFTLLVGVVAVLATIEYLQIAEKYGYGVYRGVTVGYIALLFAAISAMPFYFGMRVVAVLLGCVVFLPSLVIGLGMRTDDLKRVLPGAALSLFAIPYVGLAMLCLAFLRESFSWFAIVFLFLAVWVGDSAAYYVGRSIGKTKFAPRISPKKTWEGAIASVVGAIVIGLVWTWAAPTIAVHLGDRGMTLLPMWKAVIIAAVINVAAQLGDLFESLIKRGADVKDSGTMLPGHGGILDRIDALLFAAPVALVMFGLFGSYFS